MHPAVLVGLIGVPLILVIAVVLLLASGGEKQQSPEPETAADFSTPVTTVPPRPRPERPDREDYVPEPSKGELDMLERGWAPLRGKIQEMRRLRDEGAAAWREENHQLMQEKFHAAKNVWHEVRDTAATLLDRFTPEQVDKYLGDYEREQIAWRRLWASFQKSISIDR